MANPEHLKILKKGVKAWNKWRKENPDIEPDLSWANMPRANLSGANLCEANLSRTFLREADLRKAILERANLQEANLSKANLNNVRFCETNLCKADLHEASIVKANLERSNLSQARIYMADMKGASLLGANLYMANLWQSEMANANLENADLRYCRLVKSNLTAAKLNGAQLYGAARDNWIIKDVECEYIYWDEEGKQRSPKDRDLEPGEFERLYAVLPTIEYIFENGMTPIDPLIMDRVVQAIREKQPELDIKIDLINARGLAPSIKFTIQHEEYKKQALKEVKKEYEIKQNQLEGKLEEINKHIQNLIDRPNTINIINAPKAKYLAIDGSTLNIQETSNYHAFELNKAIEQEPEESESFKKIAKKAALDIVGNVIKDIAKGQVKEAAKQIIKLGKDLGPLFVKMAPIAYEFFKNIVA